MVNWKIRVLCLALYQGNFTISKAPVSLQEALDSHAIERANTKFGFARDRKSSGGVVGCASASVASATVNNASDPAAPASSTTTKPSLPLVSVPPPCPQALPKPGELVPVVHPASNRYHRGQVQPLESNVPVVMTLPSLSTNSQVLQPPSTAPPQPLFTRPPISYVQPDESLSNTVNRSVSGGGDGGGRVSLQHLPSLGSNVSATHNAPPASDTPSVHTVGQTPLMPTGKRPPLSTLPTNGSTSGSIGVLNDHKRTKMQQQQPPPHSSVGSNPYHSASALSLSKTSSSYPKPGRNSI
jgi:hypothetical protein